MKNLFRIILILVGILIPIEITQHNTLSALTLYLPILDKSVTTNTIAFMWICIFWGYFIIACSHALQKTHDKNLNSYINQYEKISVANEEQSDKVKILEEKIKSLEIALEKALNN